MNQQEVFDTVATHLFTQRARAVLDEPGDDACRYRAPDGKRCAVGVLIPDGMYRAEYEGFSVSEMPTADLKRMGLGEKGTPSLLTALQGVHDSKLSWKQPEAMRHELVRVAWRFGLDHGVLTDELVGTEW